MAGRDDNLQVVAVGSGSSNKSWAKLYDALFDAKRIAQVIESNHGIDSEVGSQMATLLSRLSLMCEATKDRTYKDMSIFAKKAAESAGSLQREVDILVGKMDR
jgi:hypothetical protein